MQHQLQQVMQQLGMEGGHFNIEIIAHQLASSHGTDSINYLVSANPGQPAKSLAKVASGGELSRISLAIQVIASDASGNSVETLSFTQGVVSDVIFENGQAFVRVNGEIVPISEIIRVSI